MGAAVRLVLQPPWQLCRRGIQRSASRRIYSAKIPDQHSGPELISSTGNSFVKHCVRLRESGKYRQEVRRVLVVGLTPIQEIMDAQPELEARTLIVPQGAPAPPGLRHRSLLQVNGPVLRKLTGLETPDSIAAVAELDMPPRADLRLGQGGRPLRRLLALEGVQDPGNLGTLMRSACAFGWDALLLLPGCCDPYNDKALRAARGAAFKVPLAAGGWPELLQLAGEHGLALVAAEPEQQGGGAPQADGPTGALLDSPVCLVLGSEGQGLSATALQHCSPVAIPMAGDMESLNVGIAGGILMFMLSSGLSPLVERLQRPR